MSRLRTLNSRHAIELGPVGRVVVPVWTALVLITTATTLAFGWRVGDPSSVLADVFIGPLWVMWFVVLGAVPRRGGILVGALAGALIGVSNAIVVATLPDALLPIPPGWRSHYVWEAIWSAPIIGLVLGAIGVGIGRLVRRSMAENARRVPTSPMDLPLLTDRLAGQFLRGLGFTLDVWTSTQVSYSSDRVHLDVVLDDPLGDVEVWLGLNEETDYWPLFAHIEGIDSAAAGRLHSELAAAHGDIRAQIRLWGSALETHGRPLLTGDAAAWEAMRAGDPLTPTRTRVQMPVPPLERQPAAI